MLSFLRVSSGLTKRAYGFRHTTAKLCMAHSLPQPSGRTLPAAARSRSLDPAGSEHRRQRRTTLHGRGVRNRQENKAAAGAATPLFKTSNLSGAELNHLCTYYHAPKI